jgi:hypothetical protein
MEVRPTMKRRILLLFVPLVFSSLGVTGCHRYRCCRPSNYIASAPPCCDPAPAGYFRPPHALAPRRMDALPGPQPPTRQDVLGPPAAGLPGMPPPAALGVPSVPPSVSPPDSRGYSPPPVPPPEPSWRPSPDATQTPPREPQPPGTRLYPPETSEPPRPPGKPDPATEKPATSSLPVGIPQFAMARTRVASGLKPSLEGLDWLKANGYRTVVHIRRQGEDDSADRRQVEDRRGLKFASVEVSPQNLREAIDQFNHLLSDVSCLPVFVYDTDGSLQGFLWYLHFRIVDLAPDDEARVRAGRLGLKEGSTDEQREMWLAVQKYLSGRQ